MSQAYLKGRMVFIWRGKPKPKVTRPRKLRNKTAFKAFSCSQPPGPIGIQSLLCKWFQLSAPGCSLRVGRGNWREPLNFNSAQGRPWCRGNPVQPSRELPEVGTGDCMTWSIRCAFQTVLLYFTLINTTICPNVAFCFTLASEEENVVNGEGRRRAENCSFFLHHGNYRMFRKHILSTGLILSVRLISMSSILFSPYSNMIKIEHFRELCL